MEIIKKKSMVTECEFIFMVEAASASELLIVKRAEPTLLNGTMVDMKCVLLHNVPLLGLHRFIFGLQKMKDSGDGCYRATVVSRSCRLPLAYIMADMPNQAWLTSQIRKTQHSEYQQTSRDVVGVYTAWLHCG
jgi:hypothetical protein